MTYNLTKRIRRVTAALLTLSIFVAGICLCAACIGIYCSADHGFSREAVAEAFREISFPVYFCLGFVLGAFLLDALLPGDTALPVPEKHNALILKRLHSKTDLSRCEASLRQAVVAQQKSRRLHRIITAGLLAAGSVLFLCYAMAEGSLHQSQINESMIRVMGVLVPCLAVPFGYAVFAYYHNSASMAREIALLKGAGLKKDAAAPSPASGVLPLPVLRFGILAIALSCLVYGYITGGTTDVLTKAVNICTECIGLG